MVTKTQGFSLNQSQASAELGKDAPAHCRSDSAGGPFRMMNAKLLLARSCACGLLAAACGLLVACSDYSSGPQNNAAQNKNGETTDSGSATDIVSSDGTEVSTNLLN
ncbi:MAG: hypothetical protein ACXW3Z_12265, partial [Limisphaerales bacterium]